MNTPAKTRWPCSLLAGTAAAALVAGCGSMAERNPTLDRAHAGYRSLQADPQAVLLAPTEMSQAGEALRRADAAWARRERPRTVDHMAYLAQQRVAIARETTAIRIWEKAAAAAGAEAQQDRTRASDLETQVQKPGARQPG